MAEKNLTLKTHSTVRKGLWLLGLFSVIILAQGLAHPVFGETQEEKDRKIAAEKLKKDQEAAKKAAEKLKKDQEEAKKAAEQKLKDKAEVLKHIRTEPDTANAKTTVLTQDLWLIRGDLFRVAIVEGDLCIQFRIRYWKNEKGQNVPETVTLALTAFARNDKYKNAAAPTFLVDGKELRIDAAPSYHVEDPGGVTTGDAKYEINEYNIGYDTFIALASANEISGQFVDLFFNVDRIPRAVFREMFNEISPPPPPAATTSAPAKK